MAELYESSPDTQGRMTFFFPIDKLAPELHHQTKGALILKKEGLPSRHFWRDDSQDRPHGPVLFQLVDCKQQSPRRRTPESGQPEETGSRQPDKHKALTPTQDGSRCLVRPN